MGIKRKRKPWTLKTRKKVKLDRLRAACQAKGLNWNQLAELAKITHPTLSRLNAGYVKAVNARTLHGLSAALEVPEAWLSGEQQGLPYIPERDLTTQQGSPSLWEKPTAAAVRHSWLVQKIESAVRRDLEEWLGSRAQGAYDSWGHFLLQVLVEFSSSIAWRTLNLVPSRRGSWYAIVGSDDSPSIGWLMHVLEPWFTGAAYLNANLLRRVYEVLLANPERLWGADIDNASALRGLKKYAIACRHFAATWDPTQPEPRRFRTKKMKSRQAGMASKARAPKVQPTRR
jgi:transcriptional regulator with XRE-family HTH domain